MTDRPESPYKGLAAFADSPLDAVLFFGRERERDVVVANLMASRLTLLYGPSGVGKSSLLKAGVAQALREDVTSQHVVVLDSWVEDRTGELRAARDEAGSRYLYAILDQFEEFFLYHDADGSFGTELAATLAGRGLRVNVLLSLREDSLALLDAFKGRIANLYANSLRLDHLDRESARAAVVGPLRAYTELTGERVEAEPELVEAVLDDVAGGRLELVDAGRGGVEEPTSHDRIEAPFLQLVLERLWDAERAAGSDALRVQTLRRLGGAEAIVREHLERALAGLGPAQKDVAASVFDRLVTPSGTKIAHRASDLAEYASVGEGELGTVLYALARERIVRAVDGANGAGARYEIFHDVLSDAVLAWRAERRLERARLEAERKHRRLLYVVAASLLALALTAAVAIFALTQRSQARSQARRAHARELDATALANLTVAPQVSLRDAVAAARLATGEQVEDVLRTALLASRLRAVLPAGGPVRSAVYSWDGRRILTASTDGKARIYDASSHRLLRTLDAHAPLAEAVFDRSGHVVATAGRDGTARVWDAESGRELRGLHHRGPVTSVSFSQGGQLLVTTSTDRTARIWRIGSWKLVTVLHLPGPAWTASFNNDGSRVVVRSSDEVARVFETRHGSVVHELHQGGLVTVAMFSPSGNRILTAGANRTARIWTSDTGRLLRELKGHEGRILAAAISRRGKLVATASSDGSARVWSFPGGQLQTVLVGHANYVTGVAFSPDGFSLVTTSVDRTARVWQPGTGDLRAVLAGHRESVRGASFNRDGTAVVTASDDGTAGIWDPQIQPRLRLLVRTDGRVSTVAFTRDGKEILLVGRRTRTASLVDAKTGRTVRSLGDGVDAAALSRDGARVAEARGRGVVVRETRTGRVLLRLIAPVAVDALAFAPDGRLAAGGSNGTVAIWRGGRKPEVLRAGRGAVTGVAFGPDGRLVATASTDRAARLWDAGTRRLEHVLRGHRDALTSVDVSSDGTRVVTASFDHDARVWDATTGRLIEVLRGHFGVVSDATFSPSGRWIVTAGPITAGLWDVRSGQLVFFLSGHEARLTAAAFDPSGGRILTGSVDGTVRTYLCDVCGGLDELVALAERRLSEAGG